MNEFKTDADFDRWKVAMIEIYTMQNECILRSNLKLIEAFTASIQMREAEGARVWDIAKGGILFDPLGAIRIKI